MKRNRTKSTPKQAEIDELLRPSAAARFLSVHNRTLQDWRLEGIGPSFIRLSPRAVRYRRADLEAWLARQTVEPDA